MASVNRVLVSRVAAKPLQESETLGGWDFACILHAASLGSRVRVVSFVSTLVQHISCTANFYIGVGWYSVG